MMDSPSLDMATGLENWPGPSPWEPHVSTYSKAGGGACCAATVCAGREQPENSIAESRTPSRCLDRAIPAKLRQNERPALRGLRKTMGIARLAGWFTGALQPLRNLRAASAGYPQVGERGARPFASDDKRVLLSDRSFDESGTRVRPWVPYRLGRAFDRRDYFRCKQF